MNGTLASHVCLYTKIQRSLRENLTKMQKLSIKKKKKTSKKPVNAFKCELIEEKPVDEKPATVVVVEKPAASKPKQQKEQRKFVKSNKPAGKPKPAESRKTQLYQNYLEKRKENGMPILTQKVENKIYKLKQTLRKKNVAPEEIKQIIRRKRRDEELKLRRELKTMCFNCRKTGHLLAECPLSAANINNNNNQTIAAGDICYCCGSSEHRLSQCSKYQASGRKGALPFAKCFICNQKGHLTRSCSQNTKGAYPNGGNCRFCGSIEHLIKDCPRNTNKRAEAPEIELKTYASLGGGVDCDDYPVELAAPKKKKIVIKKF